MLRTLVVGGRVASFDASLNSRTIVSVLRHTIFRPVVFTAASTAARYILGVGVAGAAVWGSGAASATTADIRQNLQLVYLAPSRLFRDIIAATVIMTGIIAMGTFFLYCKQHEQPAPFRLQAIATRCHQRSADRLMKLFFTNGGVYIKLGQHVAQLVLRHSMPCIFTNIATRKHIPLFTKHVTISVLCL
jgi:hypothetical protein